MANLKPSDFDPMRVEARGAETLAKVGNAIEAHESPAVTFAAVFSLMERLHSCDLGAPGPLVHALEAVGDYELELTASLVRKPTPLTLLMVNRILNSENEPQRRGEYLGLLERSANHALASPEARAAATRFLKHQGAAV